MSCNKSCTDPPPTLIRSGEKICSTVELIFKKLLILLLFEGGSYLRTALIWGRHLFE